MKLIGLVNSNTNDSRSHLLLKFISKEYKDLFDLDILEITERPSVNETALKMVESLSQKISTADGVIITIGKSDQIISPVMQGLIESLTKEHHSLKDKPILVMSEHSYSQESAESQLHLRQILEATSIGAYTFPGNEFFLGEVVEAIDENAHIRNKAAIEYLKKSLIKYTQFVNLVGRFKKAEGVKSEGEDLYATKSIKTTIDDLDKNADNWFEQAIHKVKPVDGNTYVKLERGILTVDQLNSFLNSMPMELTFMDANNQFLYYNYNTPSNEMLASTEPNQVGSPIAELHPKEGHQRVEMLIQQLRSGKIDTFPIHVPTHRSDKYVVHNYKAIKDKTGCYIGVNEFVLDLIPIIDWYLKQTNQKLVGGVVDAVSSASTQS